MLTGMPVAGGLHIRQAGTFHEYKLKHKIVALGECLDAEGSTAASVEFNFGRGETHYFRSQGVLANKTLPVPIRLRAWRDTAATAATHGSETWHITAGILSEARTWELGMLRKMMKLRRRPGEEAKGYNMRTAGQIKHWLQQYSSPMIPVRILKAVYKQAWKETHFSLDNGDNPLEWARSCRSAAWWQTCCGLASSFKRRRAGINHGRPGQQRADWENPFLVWRGCQWRDERRSCHNLRSWMNGFDGFVNFLAERWNLPWLRQESKAGEASDLPCTHKLRTSITDVPFLPAHPRSAH
jgi:hypothetical protein